MNSLSLSLSFSDENGCIIAWSLTELEEIGRHQVTEKQDLFLHMVSCIIDNDIHLFLQEKSGKIFHLKYTSDGFTKQSTIACGSMTFCRIAAQNGLLAFPSAEVENAVDVVDVTGRSHHALVKAFTVPKNGMCMFTKFSEDGRTLIVGFETGRLCRVSIFYGPQRVLFNEVVIEESCNDAIVQNDSILAVGASNKIVHWPYKSIEVPFAGFSSISSDGEFVVTGGWDAK